MNARDNITAKWLRNYLRDALTMERGLGFNSADHHACGRALGLIERVIETNPKINTQRNKDIKP